MDELIEAITRDVEIVNARMSPGTAEFWNLHNLRNGFICSLGRVLLASKGEPVTATDAAYRIAESYLAPRMALR